MTLQQLKEKALSLPCEPGIYIMRDKHDTVIYVGKAKKLKNRVSQYFQDTASHTPKTRIMVSKIDHFDVIIAASEFEALVLECATIKRYMPRYNILLKDGKGYPYVRLDMKQPYPVPAIVSAVKQDGALYFGPYGSRSITQNILEAIRLTLKLPGCSRQFPRDIGKDRPCLNHHMKLCDGWCQPTLSREAYYERILQAKQLLDGNYKKLAQDLKEKMLAAADAMEFELAAALRDRLQAVQALGQKQLVTATNPLDTDVIGYAQGGDKACFAVLHFCKGNLLDKEYEIFSTPDDPASAVSALLKQFYLARGAAPKLVLLPFAVEDTEIFADYLQQEFGRKTKFHIPQRGDSLQMVKMAIKNAEEEVERITTKDEKRSATLQLLAKMLDMDLPHRLESYDISNISGTDMVGSMVVFCDGKPSKGDYRHFKIQALADQDDYAAMRQVILRRFQRYKDGDAGFASLPDLLLIDGGAAHATVALEALRQLELDIPVMGMVKDDRHRTRALVTPDNRQIRIDNQQSIFSLIGTIQEETHRFAISHHRKLRSKRLRYSQLDQIPGIGNTRKAALLKTFGSIQNISNATLTELERILPRSTAAAVYTYFHLDREEA